MRHRHPAVPVRCAAPWSDFVARVALVLFGIAFAPMPVDAGETQIAGPVPARVLAIIDGDTIDVEADIWLGQVVTTRVRLLGVDAPEMKGACAAERAVAVTARDYLEELLGGSGVMLSDIQFGKYAGRVVARVTTATGADVSRALLDRGVARAYGGGKRASWCG